MGRPANVLTREFIEDRVMMLPDLPGCWIWTGTYFSTGYGVVSVNKQHIGAHRASYMVFHGDPGDLFVCHKCDNRACVNPSHLFLGTAKDNSADAVAKGRHKGRPRGNDYGRHSHPAKRACGERNALAKLTYEQVQEIKASPLGARELGRRYGVSHSQISRARRGLGWKHVP